jgi:hypothetical protein
MTFPRPPLPRARPKGRAPLLQASPPVGSLSESVSGSGSGSIPVLVGAARPLSTAQTSQPNGQHPDNAVALPGSLVSESHSAPRPSETDPDLALPLTLGRPQARPRNVHVHSEAVHVHVHDDAASTSTSRKSCRPVRSLSESKSKSLSKSGSIPVLIGAARPLTEHSSNLATVWSAPRQYRCATRFLNVRIPFRVLPRPIPILLCHLSFRTAPTHPYGKVENATAPSAGGFPVPDGRPAASILSDDLYQGGRGYG